MNDSKIIDIVRPETFSTHQRNPKAPGVDRSLLVFGKKLPMSNRVLKFFADPGAKYFTIFVLGIATLLTAISITLITRDNGRYKEHDTLESILDTRNGTIILFDEARRKK